MIGIKIAVSMISLKLILLDNSLGNSKFNTVSLVVRESIVNTYDRFYESKIREKMNLNDFITILKISILIDLGMYSMALIKNRFEFHDVDILNVLSLFPLVFIFCVFIFYLKKLYFSVLCSSLSLVSIHFIDI